MLATIGGGGSGGGLEHHQTGTRDDPALVGLDDPPVHALAQAEIVGVDNQGPLRIHGLPHAEGDRRLMARMWHEPVARVVDRRSSRILIFSPRAIASPSQSCAFSGGGDQSGAHPNHRIARWSRQSSRARSKSSNGKPGQPSAEQGVVIGGRHLRSLALGPGSRGESRQVDEAGPDGRHLPVHRTDPATLSRLLDEDVRSVELAMDQGGWEPDQPFDGPIIAADQGFPDVRPSPTD